MWFGVAAYLMWGLFPLYWKLVAAVPPAEILAHRTVWACVFLVVLILYRRQLANTLRLAREKAWVLLTSALLIGANWFTYIWGVNNGFVVECSLGYFLNPLVSVAFGVIFFKEPLRPLQRAAILCAGAGVVLRGWELGSLPALSLILAVTFALYALVRKRAQVDPIRGLAVETTLLAPWALGYLVQVAARNELQFFTAPALSMLLILGGVITALPLLCFGAAARSVSMTTLGMLQYIAPTLQFLIGTLVYGEPITSFEWIALGVIWCGVLLFVSDSLWAARRVPVPAL